ncbi:TRAP transporter substrate-binding protein, partial [Azospirillum brasilense]
MALLAACAAGALLAAPVSARDFRSADIHPGDYPTVEAVKYMGKLLSERSNGKLGVKVYPNGALGNERDTIEQIKIGGLDMMRINVAPLNNVVPETMVVALPFIFRDTDHMHAVLDGPIGDEILAAMESQGLIGLAFYDSGSRSLYSKKPVSSLADLKGMKIRVQQSDLFVSMIEALGANPTPMPMGEVYTGLKTGIVDAAENNYPSYESSRHFEAAKYFTRTEHAMAPEVLVFSKVTWDRLSKDDQAAIRKAAKDSVPYMRKLWDERELKSKDVVVKAGAQIVE